MNCLISIRIKHLLTFVTLLFSYISYCQFEQFADSYSLLTTIAGKGELDDRSAIGWLPEFENGNATDAELTRPHFAMADKAGNIYIADKDAHGIRMVSADGKIKTIAGTNTAGYNGDGIATQCQLYSPNGIWVKWDGTVYILDLGNNKIRRLNTNGTLETIVDDTDGISIGRGIWVSSNEDSIFYASSSRVKLWTEANGPQEYASGFSSLGNICMDKNGYLIATDRGGHKVYRISKDGTSKEVIAGNGTSVGGGHGELATSTGLAEVRGVWFLDDNSYFLATHEGSQVWYVDHLGMIYLFLDGKNGDEYHSGDGENYRTPGYKISEARSITVDYEGNVLITENDKGFVRRIQNDYTFNYTHRINQANQLLKANIYPNPAQNEINLVINSKTDNNTFITLYNNLGQKLKSVEIHHSIEKQIPQTIDVSALQNGVFFYTILNSDKAYTNIFIINR